MQQELPTQQGGLAEARQQVHESIQAQHPAWGDPQGECAPCARIEHELAAQAAGHASLETSIPSS